MEPPLHMSYICYWLPNSLVLLPLSVVRRRELIPSASDEAANSAGRVSPNLSVVYSVGSGVPCVSRSRRLHCVLTAVCCANDALGQCDQRGFR